MKKDDVIIQPVVYPNIEFDEEAKTNLLKLTDFEKQVIVHCHFKPNFPDERIRISDCTVLKDSIHFHESRLIAAFNISFAPDWTTYNTTNPVKFTLVFSSLKPFCNVFDLIEKVTSFPFIVRNIKRTKSDVYNVEIDNDMPF